MYYAIDRTSTCFSSAARDLSTCIAVIQRTVHAKHAGSVHVAKVLTFYGETTA